MRNVLGACNAGSLSAAWYSFRNDLTVRRDQRAGGLDIARRGPGRSQRPHWRRRQPGWRLIASAFFALGMRLLRSHMANLPPAPGGVALAPLKHIRGEPLARPKRRGAARSPAWQLDAADRDAAHRDLTGFLVARALLRDDGLSAQHAIHRVGNVAMDGHLFPALLLDHHIEGRRRFALLNTLLRMASPRLLVAQRDGLDAAHQV